jgi:hypothetical protein
MSSSKVPILIYVALLHTTLCIMFDDVLLVSDYC